MVLSRISCTNPFIAGSKISYCSTLAVDSSTVWATTSLTKREAASHTFSTRLGKEETLSHSREEGC